jgi:predicted MFS family arabinose efflux permease
MKIIAPARLAVAWLTMFLVGTELFVFSPLLPVLAAEYHVPTPSAGLAVTVFSLAYAVGAPLIGHLSDRVGSRRVLVCSLLVFSLANILTADAANLSALLAARLLAGAAAAGVSPSLYALVGAAAPSESRATWLAMAASGLLASLAFGASAGGFVGAVFGGAPVFLVLAGLSLILVWLNRSVWPSEDRDPASGPAPEAADLLAPAVLACRLVPTVVWSTGLYAVYTYLGASLTAGGFTTGQTAAAILCYGCGAIAGVLVGGRAADRSAPSSLPAQALPAWVRVCFCCGWRSMQAASWSPSSPRAPLSHSCSFRPSKPASQRISPTGAPPPSPGTTPRCFSGSRSVRWSARRPPRQAVSLQT